MSRNRKRKVQGRQAGKAVSPKQREQMLQLYGVEGNYTEVARLMRLSVGCVTKHIKLMLAEPDPQINEARKRTARELAGKVNDKANKILDSIAPHDIESGVVKVYHPETNELQRVITYGPSLMQKVTASAILVDKLKILREHELALSDEHAEGRMMLPNDIASLKSGIISKLKGLTFLNMQFETDEPDLAQRAQKLMEEAEVVDAVVEDVSMDSFDGNTGEK